MSASIQGYAICTTCDVPYDITTFSRCPDCGCGQVWDIGGDYQ